MKDRLAVLFAFIVFAMMKHPARRRPPRPDRDWTWQPLTGRVQRRRPAE